MYMPMSKKWIIVGGALVIIGAAIWLYSTRTPAFPINAKDSIASWSFKGAYTGNDTLTAQADADISHLRALLGKGQYDDYDLYIGLGNDYNLEGNGTAAYQNYNRAAAIHADKG